MSKLKDDLNLKQESIAKSVIECLKSAKRAQEMSKYLERAKQLSL